MTQCKEFVFGVKLDKDFGADLKNKAVRIDKVLPQILAQHADIHPRMLEAMRYTLEAPGKRLRAAMVMMCQEAVSGRQADSVSEIAAAAIEMVHTYSLIHDDLPAMDDDDFRRGRPSCHKQFDEPTAILAGDALLTFAFEVIASKIQDGTLAAKLISILASAAGPAGMIAGQMADLEAQNKQGSKEHLEYIHLNKTAKMFEAACLMGGACGGADSDTMTLLSRFGLKVGLAFQVADDILDVEQSSDVLGKTAGKDQQQGKLTYPALMGIDKAKQLLTDLTNQAVELLAPMGKRGKILVSLAQMLNNRVR